MRNIIYVIIVVAIGLIAGFYLTGSGDEFVPLTKSQLPATVVPLEELPTDFLEEIYVDPSLSVKEKLAIVQDQLHVGGSGYYLRNAFPDMEYLFEWTPDEAVKMPRPIFPFFHYYSPEADTTFVVCNIDLTVAICEGIQDSVITKSKDLDHCTLAKPFEKQFID